MTILLHKARLTLASRCRAAAPPPRLPPLTNARMSKRPAPFRTLVDEYDTWARVLLLTTTQIPLLDRFPAALSTEAKRAIRYAAKLNSRFAYAGRATNAAAIYVLVADDNAQAEQLVAELLRREEPFSGIALENRRKLR